MIARIHWSGLWTYAVSVIAGGLMLVAPLGAQVPEYDWYPGFRSWLQRQVARGQRGPDAVAARYRSVLEAEGIAATEIERRLNLLRDRRQELENDFWNRFFTVDAPRFNTSPNAFLAADTLRARPCTDDA